MTAAYMAVHIIHSQTCADTKVGHSSQGLCVDAHRIDQGTRLSICCAWRPFLEAQNTDSCREPRLSHCNTESAFVN